MIEFDIEIKGIEKVLAKYGPGAGPIIEAVTRGVAEDVRERVARYPGPVAKPIQWASQKQRFYVTQILRKGLGPYTRQSDSMSERLGPSWATEQRGLSAVVGTRVSYAPWVQSSKQQQPMHRNTGWVTDRQAVAEAERSGSAEKTLKEVLREW